MNFGVAIGLLLMVTATPFGAQAQEKTWQYCDTARAYYPAVTTCAVPWRVVVERPQFPSEPITKPAEPTDLTGNRVVPTPTPSASSKVISHAAERVKPEAMNGWCGKVTKPSSIVICSDPDLRRMAMARTQLFDDARENLPPELLNKLLDDQNKWVRSYAEDCGTPADGQSPTLPIAESIIDCYKHAGRKRISFLIATLQRSIPNYEPPSNWLEEIALAERLDRERQEKQAATEAERERREAAARVERSRQEAAEAEKARERLRQQAIAEQSDRLTTKLSESGYALISPVDLELDWRALWKNSKKIAIVGQYLQFEDIDSLRINNKDDPVIRLYTDEASRDARKIMLECRISDYANAKCRVIAGGIVQRCVRNKGQLNEKEIPCIAVADVFLVPEDTWDAAWGRN